MQPRLVLGALAAARALSLIGFVVTAAGSAEQPTLGALESSARTNSSAQVPTIAPAGDAESRP